MNLRKSIAALLIGGVLASLFVYPSLAAPAPVQSEADISFIAPTTPVNPVDPENPGVDTEEPGTNQPGPLSMDWVPKLSFGSDHTIELLEKTYTAVTEKPYIQVSDLRGTGSGWKVTAKLSVFTNPAVGSNSLPGAYIELNNGIALSAAQGIDPPTVNSAIKLYSNVEDLVLTAGISDADTRIGLGTWVTRWFTTPNPPTVYLTVPGSTASAGNNTATIEWTLHDAP